MSDISLFHTTHSKLTPKKISGELLPTGHIYINWNQLGKHGNVRRYVIHYKSLNSNRSHAVRVSRKEEYYTLRKIQPGHLYEIHVCAVDRANRIVETSARTQIQTKALDQAPILRVTKLTPDWIWLEWEKSEDVQQTDIRCFQLNTNGETTAVLPATENRFVFNDGEIGQRYIFQLEMITKDGKTASSVPMNVIWPGVTFPDHSVFINGCEELIICWEDPKSISDGGIESYTLHLFDSKQRLLNDIGPNPPECRQVWIKNVSKGVYFYVLEIKLANSSRTQSSPMKKIECGRETKAPILHHQFTDSYFREKLIEMGFRLIKLRDNIKLNRWQEKFENQIQQTLSTFANLTDLLRLNLTIESRSSENNLKSYRLMIDGKETSMSIPTFAKEFPLELHRRDKPYEVAVLISPDPYETKSNKVLIEASGQLPFFCAHFNQRGSIGSCSYINTFLYERQQKRLFHHGLLKSPQKLTDIQIYDLNEDRVIPFPTHIRGHRLSVVLFYLKRCVPSMTHLHYFATYASSNRAKYNYISINCAQDDLDELKKLTGTFDDIQCYTDFALEEFKYHQKTNNQPIPELLSLDGVPTYFILDYSNQLVWKGRLCAQDQLTYDRAMNHIISEFQQQPCSSENCDLCSYRSMTDAQIASELNVATKDLRSILEQQSTATAPKQQEEKHIRTRRVFSLKSSKSDYH